MAASRRRKAARRTRRASDTLPARLVALAAGEVGTREVGGNNRGARIEDYQQATWLQPAPWPWCAAFTAWVLREWLQDAQVRRALGLASDADTAKWRCRDARAFGWEEWARARGSKVLPEGHLARAGDFVVFDFSHIGIVSEDQPNLATDLATIEGNTNGAGTRESDSGDGVWKKQRASGLVRSLVRLV